MATPTPPGRTLLVHGAVYVGGALLLLLKALPVDWDRPLQLWAQGGWGLFSVIILVIAASVGSLQGLFLGLAARVPGWILAALAASIGMLGAVFFIEGPMGDTASASGPDDVVMSQLVWAAFWTTHTLVVVVTARITQRSRKSPRTTPENRPLRQT